MKKLAQTIVILFSLSLTACSTITKTDFIEKTIPPIPAEPSYYNVIWQSYEQLYCIDVHNAKNLLKNMVLMQSYQDELTKILEGL